MTYSIQQSSKNIGNQLWQWWSWIEASDAELDQVKEVIWYLHETFPKPVIKKTSRKNKFQLKQSGWGIFLLYADVNLKNNETISLSHQLSFVDADSEAEADTQPVKGMLKDTPPKEQTKVFLSYGAEDSKLALKVSKDLMGKGYIVLDMNSVKPGMPFKLAQQKLLRESDMIMGLVTSDVASPYVLDDLNRAEQSNKAAIALIEKNIKPIGLDPKLKQISFSMDTDAADFDISFSPDDKL